MMMRTLLLLAALVAAACGSTPKESYYTLSGTPTQLPAANSSAMSVVVGPVAVPDAVDRSPMVVRTGPNEVSIDDLHRWVEPLKTGIPRALAELLMRDLDTPKVVAGRSASGTPADYRVAVDVQRFESSFSGGATLDAVWTVTPAQGAPRSGRTLVQEAAPTRDHAGIAAAHRKALEKLAADIAAAIRTKP